MIQFDKHMFQMGRFNHQLEKTTKSKQNGLESNLSMVSKV